MKNLCVIIFSIVCFLYNSFGQNERSLIKTYEDSLNKYEQIAYYLNNTQLMEYLNECEELLGFFKKKKMIHV